MSGGDLREQASTWQRKYSVILEYGKGVITNTVLKLCLNIRSGKVYNERNSRVYNLLYLKF